MYNTNMNMDIIDRVPNSEETLKTDLLRSWEFASANSKALQDFFKKTLNVA